MRVINPFSNSRNLYIRMKSHNIPSQALLIRMAAEDRKKLALSF